MTPGPTRRELLRGGLALGTSAGLGLTAGPGPALGAAGDGDGPRVRAHRTLGRTGMRIADISFGSSSMSDASLVRYAYERGVNYFDSAESYRGGRAEEAIGEALAGVRDRVFLTSKTRAWANDTRAEMMTSLEASLRRLRTDYVDVYFLHAVNDVERLANEEWHEFTERAKAEGKIRFRGVSGHGSRLVPCLEHALEHDLADVLLVAFNFGQDPSFYDRVIRSFHFAALQPELPRVLERAKAKGVGILAMKTLMGARLNDLRAYESRGATYAQAAFTWVLAHPAVDALLVSMTHRGEVDEFLGASGQAFDAAVHLPLLERYALAHGADYCQHGCNVCESSCPLGVPIAEVLRTRMYALDYGRPELARADYVALGRPAEACLRCAGQPCLGACPNGIPIARRTIATARALGPAKPDRRGSSEKSENNDILG